MSRLVVCLVVVLLSAAPAFAQAPVFPVGSTVQTTPPLLNIRAAPQGVILGTAPTGSRATVTGPPVTMADVSIWYPLTYSASLSGWSNAAYLALAPSQPQMNLIITCDPSPCAGVEVNGVPLP